MDCCWPGGWSRPVPGSCRSNINTVRSEGFDTHENGRVRLAEMKKQVDGPIAQLIRDLHDRGILERTLVVIASEFGRTIANQPKAGVEPIGFAEAAIGRRADDGQRKACTAFTAISAAPTAR